MNEKISVEEYLENKDLLELNYISFDGKVRAYEALVLQ